MVLMGTETYDTVRVETLEERDRVEIAGFEGIVTGVDDQGSHVILSWHNEDTDEDEESSFWAGAMVDLVRRVW